MTRNNYRYDVRWYLRWLEERGLAGPFERQELEGYHRKPIPEEVRRFLQFLAPTRRCTTVKGYRGELRRFHQWLDARGLTTMVVVGVNTNVCVESTIRDAYHREYFAIMVPEATMPSGHRAIQEATVFNVETFLGWTTTVDQLCGALAYPRPGDDVPGLNIARAR